ncbi:regulator of cell wall mannosyl phosphorylation [Scheffersomyces coipomensis]|uniref:regulator of cell wall mannosyl phosphorylation n=1 Tax=Scheffersomyces coipomensis TaxID=1788519 RepID=UPI00315D8852
MIKSVKLPKKLFILKLFLLSLISYTVIISLTSFLNKQPIITQYKNNINRQLNLKFSVWRNNFLTTDFNLESNEKFLQELHEAKHEEIEKDNDLWYLRDNIESKLPLTLDIPNYYKKDILMKPLIQPFDPRFTLSVYFKYLSSFTDKEDVPFHWSDWVDLSKLNKFILNPKQPDLNICASLFNISTSTEESNLWQVYDYCQFDTDSLLGFKINQFTGPQNLENRELLGKAFLYSFAPSPTKIIFLTNDDKLDSIEINVKQHEINSVESSLLNNGIIRLLTSKKLIKHTINLADSFRSFIQTRSKPAAKIDALNDTHITLVEKDFDFSTKDVEDFLNQDYTSLNTMDKSYYRSLEYSKTLEDPPKYFGEAKLIIEVGNRGYGEHYDWRFFNGLIVEHEDQLLSLHRLLKNYLNFCRKNGIVTWVAHGSLLSWYWNGMGFPWDNDIDVQMPIVHLHKLAQCYNQTLIVENTLDSKDEFDGMGRYFVDVGSSITYRKAGNGNNNIDARFIDIDTGLYIDITGLSETDDLAPSRYDVLIDLDPIMKKTIDDSRNDKGEVDHYVKNKQLKAFNDRNHHFNTLDELSPLIKVVVENQISHVPKNFLIPLNNEYDIKSIAEKNYKDYIYLNNLRLWTKTQLILDYFKEIGRPTELWISKQYKKYQQSQKKEKRLVGEYEKLQINKLTMEDNLNLLQRNNQFLKEFWKTKDTTKFHEVEMNQIEKGGVHEYNVDKLIDHYKDTLPNLHIGGALKPDLFMNKVYHDEKYFDFNNRIDEILKLTKQYIVDSEEDLQKESKSEREKVTKEEKARQESQIKEKETKWKQQQKEKEMKAAAAVAKSP